MAPECHPYLTFGNQPHPRPEHVLASRESFQTSLEERHWWTGKLEYWGGEGGKAARTRGGGGGCMQTQDCENTEISKCLGPVR